MNHGQYIDTILRRFNMHECEPIDTPLDHAVVLSERDCPTTDDEKAAMRNRPYRELVGALSRFNSNPG